MLHPAIPAKANPASGERTRIAALAETRGNQARLRAGPLAGPVRAGNQAWLRRKEAGPAAPESAPDAALAVLAEPGRPLDDATRGFMETRFARDFGAVRIHRDGAAAASARAVGARAYAVGRDIVFGAGAYAPTEPAGRRLIAHELAHVIQQGQAEPIARSAPTLAAAPASLQRDTPGPAPASAAAGAGPFAGEPADLRDRRLSALAGLRTAVERIGKGLAGGFLWPREVLTGTDDISHPGTDPGFHETKAARDSRLIALRGSLVAMVQTLESGPIPQAWLAPEATFPKTPTRPGGTSTFGGSPQWTDVMTFYAIRAAGLGRSQDDVNIDTDYISLEPIPKKAVAPTAIGGAIETGTFIVVEDPDNKPLDARIAGKNDGMAVADRMFSLWHDDLGYFYIYKTVRHYLKDRPTY
jgi:hypothetical protein